MSLNNTDRPKVLFLFSDTGGGHRSAAEAIIEAIGLEYPGMIDTEMVDIFLACPPPLNLAGPTYPAMAGMPLIWKSTYQMSDGRRRARFIHAAFWPYVRRAAYRLISEHPADLIVSVHPVPNMAILRAMTTKTPYITVVTDMVSTHAMWYDHRADLVIVPTEEARQRGIRLGMPPEKFKVIGLPVADRFRHNLGPKPELRQRLGWPQDKPVILMVSGGEGMGPVERTAKAIGDSDLPAALAIITGRNAKLKAKLEKHSWNMPTYIYGFVREMPLFMQAADILVSKAGPGTISEAFIAGLPIILYSRVPGQEEGNVTYVVSEGAGVWAPQTESVIETLRRWLSHPEEMAEVSENSRSLSCPDSSLQIARIIAERLGVEKDQPAPGV